MRLIKFVSQFLFGGHKPLHEELPCEEICSVETREWLIVFDGSFTHRGGAAGVVLHNSDGTGIFLSFKLDFLCSNSKAEYEAMIIAFISILHIRIRRLRVQGDSLIYGSLCSFKQL